MRNIDQLYFFKHTGYKRCDMIAYNGLDGANDNVLDNSVNAIPGYAFDKNNSLI